MKVKLLNIELSGSGSDLLSEDKMSQILIYKFSKIISIYINNSHVSDLNYNCELDEKTVQK